MSDIKPPVIGAPITFKPPVIAPPKSAIMAGGGKFRLGGGNPEILGFEPIPRGNKKSSLFLIIVGRAGSGKNSLAYSAVEEGPVLDISVLERGTEGDDYMQQYTSRDIKRKVFTIDDKDPLNPIEASRIWDEFQKIMFALYGFQGTIVVNTIDEIYDLGRVATMPDKSMRRDYGAINRPMNDMLGYFQRVDCPTNLILISKGVDYWVKGENTGLMAYKGFPNAEFMSDCMVSMNKKTMVEPDASDKKAKGMVLLPIEKRFSCTIMRAPAAIKHEGTTLYGSDITFKEIKKRVLPVV